MGFPCGSAGKESACNARYLGSIPGLGRSLAGGHGNPLHYSGLENSMDLEVHGVCKESAVTEGLSLSLFTFRIKVMLYIPSCYYNTCSMPGTWLNGISNPVACLNLMRKTCLHRNNGNIVQQNNDKAECKLMWEPR